MRIAVVGAGAMGCLFGGQLAESGQQVCLIDVAEAQLRALRTDGLLLDTDRGARRIPVPAGRAAEFAGACGLVLLFTKGPHTEAAARSAAHLVGAESWVLTVQNGLGNAERIAAALPTARVAIGMTNWPADLAGPGHVRSHGDGEVRIWAMDGRDDPALHRIAAALSAAELRCTADPQVEVAIWEKVAFNAAMNSVSAVARLAVGPMGDQAEGRALVAAIVAETVAVAHARGLAVEAARVEAAVAHAFATHRGHKASMLQDVLAGRRTEIDTINGAIVEAGAALGVPTPVTGVLRDLVRLVDNAAAG